MTEKEILKIKEHIEIHARIEPRAVYITQIMRKAVEELEHIADLEKENAELKEKLKPENCLKLLAEEGYVKFTSDNLTKAKEKIHNLLEIIERPYQFNAPRKIQMVKEAEQFISEVEK